jgi:hypothetical protein
MNLLHFLRTHSRWIAGAIALVFVIATLIPVIDLFLR